MGKSNLHKFKMEPRYEHKRSEGLRRVAHHPATEMIRRKEGMGYYEMLEFIRQSGETIMSQTPSELFTDRFRYVRSVENGRYVWVRWAAVEGS